MLMTPSEISKKQRASSLLIDRQCRWMKVKHSLVKSIRRLMVKGGSISFPKEGYFIYINPQKDLIRFKIEGVPKEYHGFKDFSLREECSTRFEKVKEFVKIETEEICRVMWNDIPDAVKKKVAKYEIPSRLEGYSKCLHQKRDGSTMLAD